MRTTNIDTAASLSPFDSLASGSAPRAPAEGAEFARHLEPPEPDSRDAAKSPVAPPNREAPAGEKRNDSPDDAKLSAKSFEVCAAPECETFDTGEEALTVEDGQREASTSAEAIAKEREIIVQRRIRHVEPVIEPQLVAGRLEVLDQRFRQRGVALLELLGQLGQHALPDVANRAADALGFLARLGDGRFRLRLSHPCTHLVGFDGDNNE
jgi:hypothetical protein